jgi:uncharacterized MAPEG superfamily protein
VTALRQELRYGANVEAYVFWSPEGGGLGAHFDDSGAFVIPVAGAKEWRYGATPALPFPPAPVQAVDAADLALLYPWCRLEGPRPDELCRTVLRPGDALYLPAGTWHTASAVDPGGTLAVTVSFSPRPLHRSVAGLLEGRLVPRALWRQTLAPSVGDGAERHAARLDALRGAFHELRATVEAMSFEEFAAACGHDGNPSASPSSEPDLAASVAEDDWLSPTDLIRFAPGEDDDGEPCFVVTSGGGSVTVGLEALGFLEELCRAKGPFRAGVAAAWVGGGGPGGGGGGGRRPGRTFGRCSKGSSSAASCRRPSGLRSIEPEGVVRVRTRFVGRRRGPRRRARRCRARPERTNRNGQPGRAPPKPNGLWARTPRMSPPSSLLVSALLTWAMLVFAALARTRFWTIEGMKAAFGNRDGLGEPSPFAERADRAAKNMAENLPLFAAALLAATMAKVPAPDLAAPCALFVGSRLVYALLYWGGVTYLRTVAWATSLVGLVWIGALAAL